MTDLALVVGGAVSCLGVGWCIGRGVKMLRQFFDLI